MTEEGIRTAVARINVDKVKWRDVDSTNIKRIGWIPELGVMIWFKSGDRVYFYPGVPYQRAVAAVRAGSVGRYFNEHLKGKPCARISG